VAQVVRRLLKSLPGACATLRERHHEILRRHGGLRMPDEEDAEPHGPNLPDETPPGNASTAPVVPTVADSSTGGDPAASLAAAPAPAVSGAPPAAAGDPTEVRDASVRLPVLPGMTSLLMPSDSLDIVDTGVAFQMTSSLTLSDVDRDPVLGATLPPALRARAVVSIACCAPEDYETGWRAIKGSVALLDTVRARLNQALESESELAVLLPIACRSYLQRLAVAFVREHALDAMPDGELLQVAAELDSALQSADAPSELPRAVLDVMGDTGAAKAGFRELRGAPPPLPL